MDKAQYTMVVAALADVPDPRHRRGIHHSWSLLLALIGASMLAGQQDGRAVAQWVSEHSQLLGGCLHPPGGRLPGESTLRRALRMMPPDELEERLSRFATGLDGALSEDPLQGQALDGKQLRGTHPHGHSVHLVSLVRHGSARVLAQTRGRDKSSEIKAAYRLLAGRDLRGTLTTMDALLTQRKLAALIVGTGGHYLMVVKENQGEMHQAIAALFEGPWLARLDTPSIAAAARGTAGWRRGCRRPAPA